MLLICSKSNLIDPLPCKSPFFSHWKFFLINGAAQIKNVGSVRGVSIWETSFKKPSIKIRYSTILWKIPSGSWISLKVAPVPVYSANSDKKSPTQSWCQSLGDYPFINQLLPTNIGENIKLLLATAHCWWCTTFFFIFFKVNYFPLSSENSIQWLVCNSDIMQLLQHFSHLSSREWLNDKNHNPWSLTSKVNSQVE